MTDIDPRFLGGEPAVITDTSQMALALTIDWNGAADISCQIDKPTAAKYLRMVADSLDPADEAPCGECGGHLTLWWVCDDCGTKHGDRQVGATERNA